MVDLQEIKNEHLRRTNVFRRNAFKIIYTMVELNATSENHRAVLLVDEILHSIFFLGNIRKPSFSPRSIVSDKKMFEALRECFPRPFQHFSSEIPRRSPFSCVLDMIVLLTGKEKEDDIIKKLRELISQLSKSHLVSSTICVSQKDQSPNSARYYGVSMSASGPDHKRIMIAASCLSNWDSYIAGAVMTFYHENKRNPFFDGTIKLPEHVRCRAFSLFREVPMVPCLSCCDLFGLTIDNRTFPYGNCAEAESLSNLFENDEQVREQAQPTSETYTGGNREKAEKRVRTDLRNLLDSFKLTCHSPGGSNFQPTFYEAR